MRSSGKRNVSECGNLFVGMALSEATAIFALGIAMLILFG